MNTEAFMFLSNIEIYIHWRNFTAHFTQLQKFHVEKVSFTMLAAKCQTIQKFAVGNGWEMAATFHIKVISSYVSILSLSEAIQRTNIQFYAMINWKRNFLNALCA